MLEHPCFVGYCVLLLLALNNAAIQVRVATNASFRLEIFPKTLENPTNCTLTNPRTEVTIIYLDYRDGDSQTDDQKIVPLGGNQCGARINNANNADVGLWTLTLSNPHESKTEIFRVRTVTWETPVNATSTAVIGDMGTIITCGPNNILYCELKDPLGNVVPLTSRTRCQTIITGVKATDFGTWTCTVGVTGSISEIYATHTLEIGDPAEEVVIFSNKTSFGTLISWQVQRIIPAASWCRAFPPSGKSILVEPGLEFENYVSSGTDLNGNKCGLLVKGEFPKDYHGVWRLEMGLTSGRIIGGFIKMPDGKIPGPDDPTTESSAPETAEVNVAEGKSFTITCQTQYSAGYCWIKGPQGQMITSTEELSLGRCSHVVNNAVWKDHHGTWTCNMAHVNGGHEEHLTTRVNVIEKLYQALNPEIIARRGDRVVIACRSVVNHPLQYCRFVRPDGTGLGVTPGMEPSGRYSYEGPGLDRGYCGLVISSLERVDIGEWTCVSRSRFRTWTEENSDTSIVQTPETSTASVIGLSIGAILLMLIVGGIFLVRYRRKRSNNSEEAIIVEYNSS